MRNAFKVFIVAISIMAGQAFTIPLEDIKDLDLTNPGYEDLNPLHGLVWNEGILENHGELLPEDRTLRKIILLLFHRTGTFDPSTQPDTNSVVPYLTPEVIGNINGALKSGRLEIDKIVKVPAGPQYAIPRKYRNNLGTWLNELRNDPKAYRVMLALLWYKAQSKEDFERYYEGVRAFDREAVKEIPEGWLNSRFTAKDAKSLKPPEIENYDAFIYWMMRNRSNSPPLEHQGTSFVPESLADCGETSLRNFLKLAIDQNGTYNINVLKALGAKQSVIDFFSRFSTRQEQKTQAARNAWAQVTINLERVVYKQNQIGKKFEIRASTTNASENMLNVLRALFAKLKTAQNWTEIGQKIEEAREHAKLGIIQIESTNLSTEGHGEVTFAVENLGRFNWYFQSSHFYVAEIPRGGMQFYPARDVQDIAVFYPPSTILAFRNGFLYVQLRQNEIIEKTLLSLSETRQLTVNILVMLLNRLTTDDASQRTFNQRVNKGNIVEVMAHKNFRPSEAYLNGLLGGVQYDVARQLVSHKYFAEQGSFFIGHNGNVNSAMFSRDGTKVITTSDNHTCIIWNAKTAEVIYRNHFAASVTSAVFSNDGSKILTAFGDGTAHIRSAETRKVVHTLEGHVGQVNSARFNQDGTRVVTAGDDKTARIWDAETGKEIVTLKGHIAAVNSAIFSRDGTMVLTASDDKTARIWNAVTGKEIRVLKGHTGAVKTAVFSPDDARVLTASLDKTVRIWTGGKAIRVITADSPITSAVFNPYGERVLAVCGGKARIWSATTGEEVRVLVGPAAIKSAVYSRDNKKLLTSEGKIARIRY